MEDGRYVVIEDMFRPQFLKVFLKILNFIYMETRQPCFYNTSRLKPTRYLVYYQINTRKTLRIFIPCCFFDKTLSTITIAEIVHTVALSPNIQVAKYNYLVIRCCHMFWQKHSMIFKYDLKVIFNQVCLSIVKVDYYSFLIM